MNIAVRPVLILKSITFNYVSKNKYEMCTETSEIYFCDISIIYSRVQILHSDPIFDNFSTKHTVNSASELICVLVGKDFKIH